VGFAELAAKQPLTADKLHRNENVAWPNGCHVCEVEIDPDTGRSILVRYVGVDDVGRAVNPMIVHGQTMGAVAQGLGQALFEHCVYDRGSGQLLSGSLMDYSLPRAENLPDIETWLDDTPTRTNALGVKGGAYRQLAQGLQGHGITSLRVDKRGIGFSAKALGKQEDLRIDHYAADVGAWVAFLRKDSRFTKVGFIKSYLLPALFTFLIPGFGLWFFDHVESYYDRQIRETSITQIKTDNSLTEEQRRKATEFYNSTPISKLLASNNPKAKRLQASLKGVQFRYGIFRWMKRISLSCLLVGVGAFLAAGLGVLCSTRSQNALYWSLRLGWNILRGFALVEVLGQGILAVALWNRRRMTRWPRNLATM
jgi:hypothetical protein